MSALQDFVINEGLRRWNVRYYLTAIQRNGENDFSLHVAYEVGLCGLAPIKPLKY
jgi:phosphatidylinositol N-acetylglucosaminyltransferase subunit H